MSDRIIDTAQLKTTSFVAGYRELYLCLTLGRQDPHGIIKCRLNLRNDQDHRRNVRFCRQLRSQARKFGLVVSWYDSQSRGLRYLGISKKQYRWTMVK